MRQSFRLFAVIAAALAIIVLSPVAQYGASFGGYYPGLTSGGSNYPPSPVLSGAMKATVYTTNAADVVDNHVFAIAGGGGATNIYRTAAGAGVTVATNSLLYTVGVSPYQVFNSLMITNPDAGSAIWFDPADASVSIIANAPISIEGVFVGNGGGLTNLDASKLVGNIAIDGSISAASMSVGSLSGDGVALTNLNASELRSGTVPNARLPVAPTVNGLSLSGTNGICNLALGSYFTNTLNGTNLYLSVTNGSPLQTAVIEIIQGTGLTNTVRFNTNYTQPSVFGQILTMPTNSSSSRQYVWVVCGGMTGATNTFTQQLKP